MRHVSHRPEVLRHAAPQAPLNRSTARSTAALRYSLSQLRPHSDRLRAPRPGIISLGRSSRCATAPRLARPRSCCSSPWRRSRTPCPGTYTSALRPGMNPGVQIGRASTSRQFPNSGNPKIFNGQSWNGSALGAQWEIQLRRRDDARRRPTLTTSTRSPGPADHLPPDLPGRDVRALRRSGGGLGLGHGHARARPPSSARCSSSTSCPSRPASRA